MKSPRIERIFAKNDDEMIRELTPEKINFDSDQEDEDNDTPTFNSHNLDAMSGDHHNSNDKENIDVNRKVHCKEEIRFEAKAPKNYISSADGEGEFLLAKNERIPEFLINHEHKSRGSTSPDSLGKPKIGSWRNKLSEGANFLYPSPEIRISKVNESSNREELKLSEMPEQITPNQKKRKAKAARKELELNKMSSASSEKPKGCTCKKSQ